MIKILASEHAQVTTFAGIVVKNPISYADSTFNHVLWESHSLFKKIDGFQWMLESISIMIVGLLNQWVILEMTIQPKSNKKKNWYISVMHICLLTKWL